MKRKIPSSLPHAVPAAALLLLAALTAAAQTVLSVKDFHRSSKTYVGNSVQVTGLAFNVRQELKRRNGQDVAFTSFNLYEVDAKGKKGKYYIYVSIPAGSFKTPLEEGGSATITGAIQWPYQIGRIDDTGP